MRGPAYLVRYDGSDGMKGAIFMEDTVLQRFRQFRAMIISASVPNDILLDMLESYITSNDEAPAVEEIPILDGQLSLMELDLTS